MPIRMEEDPQESGNNRNRRQTGGGGGLMMLLPIILRLVGRNPKLLLLVAVLGGAYYFFSGSFNMGGGDAEPSTLFSSGMNLDEKIYDKAEVFEPLSNTGNQMPTSASLIKYAPRRLNQGRQGSCVGWASGYAARTILYARATGKSGNSVPFSPSFVYNQIALQGCQGAYMMNAMKTLKRTGALPFSEFGYNENSCGKKPNSTELSEAGQFKIRGYNRLSLGGNNYKTDLNAIRQNLAQGAPVVIGMQVGGSFMQNMFGKKVWRPTRRDRSLRGFSGHAMCVIGYDDKLDGGAFQIMNSWGPEWGENGVAWVRYPDFDFYVKEAYGLYPMGSARQTTSDKFAIQFGLLDYKTGKNIALKQKGKNLFQTKAAIRKGDKFKIMVNNSVECYTYVFGQETDGSSYVLFPYTRKHSPYCGITGTRFFPKDYSMKADAIGKKDFMAVVVSKKELDYNRLNKAISQSSKSTYSEKLNDAIGSQAVQNIKYKAGETVQFEASTKGRNVVGVVLEIDKR